MRSPGIEVRPLRQLTGEAEFNEIFLTDVRVPRESLLGEIGGGWQVAMTTLLHERGTLGVALVSRLEVAVRKLVELARDRGATLVAPGDEAVGHGRAGEPFTRSSNGHRLLEVRASRVASRLYHHARTSGKRLGLQSDIRPGRLGR